MLHDFVRHVIEPVDPQTYPTSLWLFDMWGGELRSRADGPTPFKVRDWQSYSEPALTDCFSFVQCMCHARLATHTGCFIPD